MGWLVSWSSPESPSQTLATARRGWRRPSPRSRRPRTDSCARRSGRTSRRRPGSCTGTEAEPCQSIASCEVVLVSARLAAVRPRVEEHPTDFEPANPPGLPPVEQRRHQPAHVGAGADQQEDHRQQTLEVEQRRLGCSAGGWSRDQARLIWLVKLVKMVKLVKLVKLVNQLIS